VEKAWELAVVRTKLKEVLIGVSVSKEDLPKYLELSGALRKRDVDEAKYWLGVTTASTVYLFGSIGSPSSYLLQFPYLDESAASLTVSLLSSLLSYLFLHGAERSVFQIRLRQIHVIINNEGSDSAPMNVGGMLMVTILGHFLRWLSLILFFAAILFVALP
jgi:hypothetical protein